MLQREDDLLTGRSRVYVYNTAGQVKEIGEFDTDDLLYDVDTLILYNANGRVSALTNTIDYLANGAINKVEVSNHYSYTNDGRLTSSYISSGIRLNVTYEYDLLNRVSETEYKSNTSNGFENLNEYTYINSSLDAVSTSGQVTGHVSSVFKGSSRVSLNNYSYEYDDRGNITRIVQNGYNVYYHYDDLGQLVREDNEILGETYEYGYDKAGNITIKRVYSYTTTEVTSGDFTSYIRQYTNSAWGDQMTAYDGTDITYDAIGNPLSYYNGTSYIFTWNGRQLVTATKGSNSYSFVYNSDGIRTEKTVNGVVHTYHYTGTQLFAERWVENGIEHVMTFLYDANGVPLGFKYRNSSYAQGAWDGYWYERNLQGDIVAIYNDSNVKLVSYAYDAWGNHTPAYSNGGASIVPIASNPLRYRGYYYDADLGLYYLQTRYYDSNTGRFINADGYISTGTGLIGYNMYAYCNNNPVMYVDSAGNSPGLIWGLVVLGALVVLALTSCSPSSSAEPEAPSNITESVGTPEVLMDEKNTKDEIKKDENQVENINVTVYLDDISGWSNDNEKVIAYTNALANKLETEHAGFLNGSIDRVQLYSEIKFHIVHWDNGTFVESANPAELNIYSDGKVIDHRFYVNFYARLVYGGEYYE